MYLRNYISGSGDPYTELSHEHVPAYRIGVDSVTELIRALILVYSGADAPAILPCYLNERGQKPAASRLLRITVEYPEPGVIRTYCGTDVQAWFDSAIDAKSFRPQRTLPHRSRSA